jgi:hypothetical protein
MTFTLADASTTADLLGSCYKPLVMLVVWGL